MKKSNTEYSFGYGNNMIETISLRTFERCAKFAEPYIEPEMTILDCGCGPGSITLGFAKRVSKGRVVAIDIEQSQLDLTQQAAKKAGINNIEVQKANILELPFKDCSFDLVYTHAVLCQLKDYKRAVAELYRVVKHGGIVAVREPDHIQAIYPEDSLLLEAMEYRVEAMARNGVGAYIGRELRHLFLEAGFKRVVSSGSVDSFGDEDSVKILAKYYSGELIESPWSKQELKVGNISMEKIELYQQAWKNFSENPAAFHMFNWCEVIGIKRGEY